MKRILVILIFTPVFLSAQISVKKPELVFDQLLGTWQFGSNMEFEEWNKVGHTYYAKVYSITNGDTTISENCRIYKQRGKYYYEQVVVLNKISNASVYKLIALDLKFMEFENRALTFPQKIGYEWVPNGELAVIQEGLVGGKLEFVDFSYKKVK